MNIKNLEEAIKYVYEINKNCNEDEIFHLDYNIDEGSCSIKWYEAILEEVKKLKPKRVIDIGSNLNLFGYLFANEGIEYIGIDMWKNIKPIQTNKIKFINEDYYNVRELFKNDIIISNLCVSYLIPIEDVKAKHLIINSHIGSRKNV